MKKYENDTNYEAMKNIVLQTKAVIDYITYFSVFPEANYRYRYSLLNQDKEISPFVVHYHGNLGIIKTSSRQMDKNLSTSKFEYQTAVLKRCGFKIYPLSKFSSPDLYLHTKNLGYPIEEERILPLSDRDLKLHFEISTFITKKTILCINVEDTINGYMFKDKDLKLLKESRKKDSKTRVIEQHLLQGPERIHYLALFPESSSQSSDSSLRGFLKPVRDIINRALIRSFPLLNEFYDGKFPDTLIDVYGPRIIGNELVRSSQTQFILK